MSLQWIPPSEVTGDLILRGGEEVEVNGARVVLVHARVERFDRLVADIAVNGEDKTYRGGEVLSLGGTAYKIGTIRLSDGESDPPLVGLYAADVKSPALMDGGRHMPDTITARNAVPVVFDDDFKVILQVVKPSSSGLQAKFIVSGKAQPELTRSDWTSVGGAVEILGHAYELRSIERTPGNLGTGHGYKAVLVLKTDDAEA
jgi:hypothetical protein